MQIGKFNSIKPPKYYNHEHLKFYVVCTIIKLHNT